MPRILLILLFVFCAFKGSIVAQIPVDIYAEGNFLSGKVKEIILYRYSFDTGKKKKTSKTISKYNNLTQLVLEKNYYSNGARSVHKFEYDSLGNLFLDIDDDGYRSYRYQYDGMGRVLSKIEQYGSGKRIIDSIIYNSENLPIHYNVTINFTDKILIKYIMASEGRKKQISFHKKSDENDTDVTKFFYNQNGFIAKRIRNTAGNINGTILKEVDEYEFLNYKYDKFGNWISRTTYLTTYSSIWKGAGRHLLCIERRKIRYYK